MEIQQIKQRLTLAEVIKHYGLKADKQARLKCPFHNDRTPSLQLYYKTQTAFCFSTNCTTHGKAIDVVDFILYYEKCNKHEAIKKAESIINPGATAQTIATTLRQDQDISNEKAMFLERMFTYFKNAVHNSKPAREYIESRNLDYKQLEIGYNAGHFHHGTRKDEGLIEDCLKYGVLLDLGLKSRTGETAYKPFGKWCLCFALRNQNHEITGLYFRSTLAGKDQRHFYLRDRSGLYPGYPKPETQKLILTESIIDAASLLQHLNIGKYETDKGGSPTPMNNKYASWQILSLYGTNGFTEEHQTAIRKLKHLTEIIFFLNGDEPGNKAVAKYAPMLKAEYPNLTITSVAVPENEDVNSLLQSLSRQSGSHSPEILTHLIESRKEVDFIFSSDGEPPQAFSFSNENQMKEKSTVTEEPEPTKPKAPITGLDTANPYNPEAPSSRSGLPGLDCSNPYSLRYKGNEASYQIKGFRTDQPDSLKITIQIISE